MPSSMYPFHLQPIFAPGRFAQYFKTHARQVLIFLLVAVIAALATFSVARAAAAITAAKTYAFVGGDGDGKADPGETIEYSVVVTNTSGGPLTGVQYADTIDANTTLVGGSLMASPIAADDSYTATGNLSISIPAGSGVLANDFLGLNPAATITASDAASANGGSVSVAADGSFTYEPPVGFTGADTFQYTLSNSAGSSTGTVTVTVSNMVWFVNNSAGACPSAPCDGRFSHPFTTLAAFSAVNDGAGAHPKTGQSIFIYQGTTNYSGSLTLLANQRLIGQGDALDSTTLGFTPAANGPVLPGATLKPTLTGTLTLANGVTVLALNLSTGTSAGIVGTSGSGITLGDSPNTATNGLTVTTTSGAAVSLSNLNGAFTFRAISANGAANGVSLTNTTGSFTVTGDGGNSNNGSGGVVSNTTGAGILLNNAVNVSLGYMNITNSGANGIRGTTVNGFTLNRSNISDNAGNVAVDDGLGLSNTRGTLTLTDNSIANSRHQGVTIDNFNTNLDGLTISNITVSGTAGGDGVLIQMRGNSVLTTGTIANNTFSNNSSTGLQVNNADTGNISSLTVQSNLVDHNNAGMDFDLSQSASMTVTVLSNVITFSNSQALNLAASTSSTGGTMTATLRNNTIGAAGGTPAQWDSGSAIGNGIRVANGGTNVFLTIDGNIIREVPNGRGIDIEPSAYIPSLNVKARIVNNQVIRPSGTHQDIGCGLNEPCPLASIFVLSDDNGMGGFDHVCTVISGNTAYDPTSWPLGYEAAYYLARRTTAANTLTLEGSSTPYGQILGSNTVTNFMYSDFIDEGELSSLPTIVVPPGTCGVFPASLNLPNSSHGVTRNASWTNPAGGIDLAVHRSFDDAGFLAPSAGEPRLSSPQLSPALAGESVSLSVGALPAGKSVTIKYRVTVNGPSLPLGTFQLSNQGTVSYDPGQTTLTDDPSVGGASDPTTIPVDRPDTALASIARAASSPTNAGSVSWTVTFADPVINLVSSSFTLVKTGLGGTPAITAVTANSALPASAWTVTASTGTGDGSFGLNFTSDAGLSHDVTNAPFTGEVYTVDRTPPSVTIDQAAGQSDPATGSPVNFTVVFSEPVSGFAAGDVGLSASTAPGTLTGAVTGGPTTYNMAVSGMTGDGTVIASIAAGAAQDAAGNLSAASTSADNSVLYDTTPPSVSINQAAGQLDPTRAGPIHFTTLFSEPVTGFATGDVTLASSFGPLVGTVTEIAPSDGTTYDVSVTGMSGSGTVTAAIDAGVAFDLAAHPNTASTSADNTVTYDDIAPDTLLTANPANPANSASASFSFSGSDTGSGVAGFSCSLDGGGFSACTSTKSYSGLVDGSHTFQVRAADNAGNVDATPASFTWVLDSAAPDTSLTASPSNPTNAASASFTFTGSDGTGTGVAGFECKLDGAGFSACTSPKDYTGLADGSHTFQVRAVDNAGNTDPTPAAFTWTVDTTAPTVVMASLVPEPTNASTFQVTVTFSEPVTGFTPSASDLFIVNGTASSPAGSGATYTFNLSPSSQGFVSVDIPAGRAQDAAGNPNLPAAQFYRTYDSVRPTVTINLAIGQADPATSSPVNFTVVFSEPVSGFAAGDVDLSASTTPGILSGIVTGGPDTYNVAVSGMTGDGVVSASLAAGAAQDAAGNLSAASTSADNSVLYDITPPSVSINQAVGQLDPTRAAPIHFTAIFSEPVTGFANGDVTLTSPFGSLVDTVTEIAPNDGTRYDVAVTGMSGSGSITATIGAGIAVDLAGNPNTASTSTDNTVTYDDVAPTVSLSSSAANPTNTSPIPVSVTFSKSVTGFTASDIIAANGTVSNFAGSGATYSFDLTPSADGPVDANIAAGVAQDAAGNSSTASSQFSRTYDSVKPTVTVNQAAGQADPTSSSPINFTVVFSEAVAGFTSADVSLGGTAAPAAVAVTGSGTTYNLAVSGMTGSGTVTASIEAGKVKDLAGNGSSASTSTDNMVTFDATAATTTALTASENLYRGGQRWTFTATVSTGAGTPTGTVTFKDGAVTLGASPLVNGSASLSVLSLSGGAHSITAEYGGDSTHAASLSPAVVVKAKFFYILTFIFN